MLVALTVIVTAAIVALGAVAVTFTLKDRVKEAIAVGWFLFIIALIALVVAG